LSQRDKFHHCMPRYLSQRDEFHHRMSRCACHRSPRRFMEKAASIKLIIPATPDGGPIPLPFGSCMSARRERFACWLHKKRNFQPLKRLRQADPELPALRPPNKIRFLNYSNSCNNPRPYLIYML